MSGLLSLKWNNHAPVFLRLLQNLRLKELYCDTTIICDDKFYPVHKLVLSTCSVYFEEIFDKIDCKHPFIIMRDLEPCQLEALLNYMYKGEVNVLQESLPGLIKAAETLKIRGLAVPDDSPPVNEKRIPQREKRKLEAVDAADEKRRSNETCENGIMRENSDSTFNQVLSENSGRNGHHLTSSQFNGEPQNTGHDQVAVKLEPPEPPPLEAIAKEEIFTSTFPYNSADDGKLQKEPKCGPYEAVSFQQQHLSSNANETVQSNLINKSQLGENSSISWTDERSTLAIEQRLSRNAATLDDSASSLSLFRSHQFKVNQGIPKFLLDSYDPIAPASNSSGFKHKCSFCPYGSYSSSAVKKHEMRIHTCVKPFRCSRCQYCSTTKESLRIHFRKHTGERPYHCSHCTKKFSCYANLKKHKKCVHKLA